MPEVSRALLLPDISLPQPSEIYAQLLVWDDIEIPLYTRATGRNLDKDDPGIMRLRELEDAGVVVFAEHPEFAVPPEMRGMDEPSVPFSPTQVIRLAARMLETNDAFCESYGRWLVKRLPELPITAVADQDITDDEALALFRAYLDWRAVSVADWQVAAVADAVAWSSRVNRAPLATGLFNHYACLLPPPVEDAPRQEGALLSAAVRLIDFDPATPVQEVLAFRERHAKAIGRFRASLLDLAENMRRDAPPPFALEEAHSIIKNRVEPRLSDLDALLKAGRVQYFFRAMFTASTIVATAATPAAAVAGAGEVASRSIAYAFDRERLIREHPYGYLHHLHAFARDESREHQHRFPMRPIENPPQELRELLKGAISAGAEITERNVFGIPLPPEPGQSRN